ncbi:hypothetical protein ABTO96_19875, partial [Acinetobacter baumannii]
LWVLLITLLPLGGSLLYGLFGINRYQRRARRLFPEAVRRCAEPGSSTAARSTTPKRNSPEH